MLIGYKVQRGNTKIFLDLTLIRLSDPMKNQSVQSSRLSISGPDGTLKMNTRLTEWVSSANGPVSATLIHSWRSSDSHPLSPLGGISQPARHHSASIFVWRDWEESQSVWKVLQLTPSSHTAYTEKVYWWCCCLLGGHVQPPTMAGGGVRKPVEGCRPAPVSCLAAHHCTLYVTWRGWKEPIQFGIWIDDYFWASLEISVIFLYLLVLTITETSSYRLTTAHFILTEIIFLYILLSRKGIERTNRIINIWY